MTTKPFKFKDHQKPAPAPITIAEAPYFKMRTKVLALQAFDQSVQAQRQALVQAASDAMVAVGLDPAKDYTLDDEKLTATLKPGLQ